MFKRHPLNPLITTHSFNPSRPDFEIVGTFNAGATTYNGEVLLLVRVAERPVQTDPDVVLCPYLEDDGELILKPFSRADERYDTSDSRLVVDRHTGATLLTSISHIRLARSQDGVHFQGEHQPWLSPTPPYENFGAEDARVTQIDDIYYVNYSAVSAHGISTALASTTDFKTANRLGIIFPPANRDMTLFPQRINGQYVAYHRPMPSGFGRLNIWIATSPDLVHWGEHQIVMQASNDGWDSGRIGGGAPPVWTEKGWLSIYHAADHQNRYCLGAFLTPLDEPGRIIAHSPKPILTPEAPYETNGFFSNVVFTCGSILQGDLLRVYYGASDQVMALAEASVNDVLASLEPVS
ncbi:MAG: glycoside hydrolase family 130 protein [Chloroflexi bacterium]|nr:glycoside hydrolase family 130 protein [Chloroflexota bacterium]MCC6892904.1 glycoside hydrolase family 130 protein [Anaerolineae bacterium]